MRTNQRAVVIGAGIAGMATAGLLAKEGYTVTVLEARSSSGGRAGVLEEAGFTFDRGPSWYLMPEVFDHFFALMGSRTDEHYTLRRLDPGYQVLFEDGDAVRVSAEMAETVAEFERRECGAGRALHSYLNSASQIYDAAVAKMLYNTFRSPKALAASLSLRQAILLAKILPWSLRRWINRRFRNQKLRQILGYPAVFLGASPKLAPALFQLMSRLDLVDGVQYPEGGFSSVLGGIRRVAEGAGVTLVYNTSVTRILVDDAGAVRGVEALNADGVVREVEADIVVSSADLHHTETQLVPESMRSYPETWWTNRIPGPGAVLVYLGVRGLVPKLEHHNLLFVDDWDANFEALFDGAELPNPTSIYVCKPSQTDSSVAPEGHENIFILVPVAADVSLGHGDAGLVDMADGSAPPTASARVQAIADAAVAQVASWAGVANLEERIVYQRTVGPADFARDFNSWKGTSLGPAHTLRQSAFFRGSNASKKIAGLYYAGSTTTPGVGLPMCLISAENVIKELRGDTSVGPLPEPGITQARG